MRVLLGGEAKRIAGKVAQGVPLAESLREYLALTIAVVVAAEQLYRAVGQPHPDQWESLERSAETFMDHFVVKWLAEGDPELKRAVTRHRRRKLAAHRGVLRLVESDRNKRARGDGHAAASFSVPGAGISITGTDGGFGTTRSRTASKLIESPASTSARSVRDRRASYARRNVASFGPLFTLSFGGVSEVALA